MKKLSELKAKRKNTSASKSPFALQGLDQASTYSGDMQLFKQLSLKSFKNISGDYYVGEVLLPNKSSVKIWVYAAPALFWKFEIFDAESRKTTIASTGSGKLLEYWPTVQQIANNMFVIDEVK